tara:strand:+ start:664 stop:822 length:159 start_codon:yes stop_codon:yes gene_type:complete
MLCENDNVNEIITIETNLDENEPSLGFEENIEKRNNKKYGMRSITKDLVENE